LNKKEPLFVIIILNYNGWGDTVECLESILRNTYKSYKIIVVDNNSDDNSSEYIKAWCENRLNVRTDCNNALKASSFLPSEKLFNYREYSYATDNAVPFSEEQIDEKYKLILVRTGDNLGYARGNNIGVRYAFNMNPEYICILNNDTLLEPDFIENIVNAFAELPPSAAVLGPRILDYKDLSDWQRPEIVRHNVLTWIISRFFFRKKRNIKHDFFLYKYFWYTGESLQDVYMLAGSCLVFKAEVLKKIDGFDEKTFLYWEEGIIAEKILNEGLKEYYSPAIKIYHKWNRSIGKEGFLFLVDSSIYFFRKYRGSGLLSISLLKLFFSVLFVHKCIRDEGFRNKKAITGFTAIMLRKW
jgi:GT2 family glycosyltransferase